MKVNVQDLCLPCILQMAPVSAQQSNASWICIMSLSFCWHAGCQMSEPEQLEGGTASSHCSRRVAFL